MCKYICIHVAGTHLQWTFLINLYADSLAEACVKKTPVHLLLVTVVWGRWCHTVWRHMSVSPFWTVWLTLAASPWRQWVDLLCIRGATPPLGPLSRSLRPPEAGRRPFVLSLIRAWCQTPPFLHTAPRSTQTPVTLPHHPTPPPSILHPVHTVSLWPSSTLC